MQNRAEIEYRVPYADTDKMGVVYYANYLVYFERLRTELLREAGLSYFQMEEDGIMLPVIEAVCKYKKSAAYDDLLSISAQVDTIKGPKVTISCEVRKNNELLVFGHTIHACISTETRRPVRPPAVLMDLLHQSVTDK
jgi:acyl-CoA thioester hydrolase